MMMIKDINDYEWDERKNELNLIKHSIPLRMGVDVFLDPLCLIKQAKTDIISGEARYMAKGMVAGKLLLVIYVQRGDNRRLISVHKLEKRKANDYYSQKEKT